MTINLTMDPIVPILKSYISGKKHYEAAQYYEAIACLRAALDRNLHFMPTYYFLGKSYLATHQFKRAEACFSEFFLFANANEKCVEYAACLKESKNTVLTSQYMQAPLLSTEDKELLLKINDIQDRGNKNTPVNPNRFWCEPSSPRCLGETAGVTKTHRSRVSPNEP